MNGLFLIGSIWPHIDVANKINKKSKLVVCVGRQAGKATLYKRMKDEENLKTKRTTKKLSKRRK